MTAQTPGIERLVIASAPTAGGTVQSAIYIIAILTALRFLLAAYLPLSFDEAYFWLWSKHLALSYYDHPPMIALAIRLGTLVFGDTEFGVRFIPLLASVGASWAVWRSAAILSADKWAAMTVCCLFNATLMVAAESMGAIPDSLVLAAASFLMFAMAKLEATRDGRWWLAAGLALGTALLTKYTALFLGVSVTLWLLVTSQGRVWLRSSWPYLGGLIALAFVVSTVVWNAMHDWISFKFQFGRMVAGDVTFQYLVEFILGQLVLASPFIAILGATGLVRELRSAAAARPFSFAVMMVLPALAYFMIHALHGRVQGNWPSFIYPGFIVLATSAITTPSNDARVDGFLRLSRSLAIPIAACILIISYSQAFFGILPMGKRDPIARMTAVGLRPVADAISMLAQRNGDRAIVTSKYALTSWLAFYIRPPVPVIQVTEDYRWLSAPRAGLDLLRKPLLYVTQSPEHELPLIVDRFSRVEFVTNFKRMQSGVVIDTFYVYSLSDFHGTPVGRVL